MVNVQEVRTLVAKTQALVILSRLEMKAKIVADIAALAKAGKTDTAEYKEATQALYSILGVKFAS